MFKVRFVHHLAILVPLCNISVAAIVRMNGVDFHVIFP